MGNDNFNYTGMKTMTICLLSVILFCCNDSVSAQTSNKNPLPQFVFPSFTKGVVKMKSGDSYSALFNYNMVDEEMIFNNKGQYLALENISSVDTIIIGARKFVPVQKVFYEVIIKGTVSIYIQHKSKYTDQGTPTAYGMTSKTNSSESFNSIKGGNQIRTLDLPDNVVVSPDMVYWAKVNDEMKKFTSERQFLKLFTAKETELKDYIKKNAIEIEKREDLIKLGNYCNEILK
jgi:hypothetical protein